ncbi:MAG: septum formation initiator family protein, partial [Ferruginibacter sp.]|nr:septum formation initiator family protein [Ferruginibacter sp.]
FFVAKNKYFIAVACFTIWMLFFDPKDLSLIFSRRDKLKELQKSEQVLAKKITETRTELNLLRTSALTIEKYAREKYLMKKDNEDLFIVNAP